MCHFNLPPAIAPSDAPNTCTHLPTDIQNTEMINKCSSSTQTQATCVPEGCKWNFFEDPNNTILTCTHPSTESTIESKVNLCKNLQDRTICE
jgi:hypothetical protein